MDSTEFKNQQVDFMEKRTFQERRKRSRSSDEGRERRQFGSSYKELSEEGQRLGTAVDRYKMENSRRFINFDELLQVIHELGYRKSDE